jgi:hypothetical protein
VNGSYVANVLPAMILTSLGMGAVACRHAHRTTGLGNRTQGCPGLFNTSQQIGGALGLVLRRSPPPAAQASCRRATRPEALVHGSTGPWRRRDRGGRPHRAFTRLRAGDVARIEAEARSDSKEPVFASAA